MDEAQEPESGTPEWYAHMEARRRKGRHYACYVTVENVDHIASRFANLVRSGRRMTLVEHIGESATAYQVKTGLTLDERARTRIGHTPGEGVGVYLTPGIVGFGASAWGPMGPWKTLHDLHAELDRHRKAREAGESHVIWRDPEHTYVSIDGGLDTSGAGREDRIVIKHQNSHGVMCTKEIVFDADRLHYPPTPTYRWEQYDPDGSGLAEDILEHVPDHVRWAVLRSVTPDTLASTLADLDVTVRPWAHQED